MENYNNQEFNAGTIVQVSQRVDRFQEELGVSTYTKIQFDSMQMKQILLGLYQGLDTSIYTNPEFDPKQMEQIRLELLKANDMEDENLNNTIRKTSFFR